MRGAGRTDSACGTVGIGAVGGTVLKAERLRLRRSIRIASAPGLIFGNGSVKLASRSLPYRSVTIMESPTGLAAFRTSPSALARYFFHDCERFLYYRSITPEQRKRLGIPEPEFGHSPLIESILQSGYSWEKKVVEEHLRGKVRIAEGEGDLHQRRFGAIESVHQFRLANPGEFVYQPTLSLPMCFYDRYGIDATRIVVSDNHPDLIEVLADPERKGGKLLRVLDVKRGNALKLTHRIQVLLYALELQAVLEAAKVQTARADLTYGGIWLGDRDEADLFEMAPLVPHVERFLRDDLMRVLVTSTTPPRWHLYERCEWCEFFAHCRAEMQRADDISRLERLTPLGKRHLQEAAGIKSLVQLGTFLRRADADEVLGRCASLAGQRHLLTQRVTALEQNQPILIGAASPDLPKGEHVAVFLTVQQEPLAGSYYLAGLLVGARFEVRQALATPTLRSVLLGPEEKPVAGVWLAEQPEHVAQVRRDFVHTLAELLKRVHEYNRARPDAKQQLMLQAYVHSEKERADLLELLLQAVDDPILAESAMLLLFHFQGPELLEIESHPREEVAYPVVVLLNAVRRLLALPIEVSYTLPEMLKALGSSFNYARKDYYHFAFGHGLRAEAIHAAWYRGAVQNLSEIRTQGKLYLFAMQALLRAIRERAREQLVAWPPRFKLPSGAGIRSPLLSKLAFFARYESLIRCLAIRESRTEARQTQVLRGQVIELQALLNGRFAVVGDLVNEPEADDFPRRLLVEDSEDGRRAQIEYADYWYRNQFHAGPPHPHRALASIAEISRSPAGTTVLRLNLRIPFQRRQPKQGERFLLYERFTDFTTDKVVSHLEQIDRAGSKLFLDLVNDPEAATLPLPLPKKVAAAALKSQESLTFTPSQITAFEALCKQRVTAVWGPPGTGKTHFLATAIAVLAEAHRSNGQSFRVLVTAFTHAAIENLLRKLSECAQELRVPLAMAKAKYWQGRKVSEIEVIEERNCGDFLKAEQVSVIGSTVHSALKQKENRPEFDLVVIDEASQVRVPEAAIPIEMVARHGRLVLAGDHLQLPPIVAGTYPEPDPEQPTPLLHRSIFEAVIPRGTGGGVEPAPSRILRPLWENFRMCDTLTRQAATLLYGPRYRPATNAIAARRLPMKMPPNAEPFVKFCLDPAYPFVLLLLHGRHGARANPFEAAVVAELIVALRKGMRTATNAAYPDDATFFREGVVVVSPHHAQIRAIRSALAEAREWTAPPFVDTVDKMQGQEAEAVIVSYGVADPEFAAKEATFIYSVNRLNVSLTRGRSKCILCLPQVLLEGTTEVMESPTGSTGLAFMRRLTAWAEAAGESATFTRDEATFRAVRVRSFNPGS